MEKDLLNMYHDLCRESIEFSGSKLSGENLNIDMKQVYELSRISDDIKRGKYDRTNTNTGRRKVFIGIVELLADLVKGVQGRERNIRPWTIRPRVESYFFLHFRG